MFKKTIPLFCVYLLCLLSCVPSDGPDTIPDDDQVTEEEDEKGLRSEFSYKVDGEEVSGAVVEGENNITTITGEIDQNADHTSISIGSAIFYPEKLYAVVLYVNTTKPFASIKEGDIFAGNTTNPILLTIASLGIADFDEDTEDFMGDLKTYENQNLQIKFTKIDHENKLVSGTFSFDSHSSELDIHKKVTDGVFTNIRLKD